MPPARPTPKLPSPLPCRRSPTEIHQPVETVQVVYERELIELQATARIKDYVALFAGRRTREVLQRGGH